MLSVPARSFYIKTRSPPPVGNSARSKRQKNTSNGTKYLLESLRKWSIDKNYLYAHVWCIQACVYKHFMYSFPYVQIGVNIWPWGLGQRRTPVGGQHVPLATVTNSSNRISISCKLIEICQFMCLGHFAKFQTQKVSRDMANWNFVTSALRPHFQGQGRGYHFDICVLPLSRTTSTPKISFPAPWADFVTHTHTHRAHHPITARAIYSSRCN